MTFLQTQTWPSCFEVFNQGSRVHQAEWEQSNTTLLPVMPVIQFSPTSLQKRQSPDPSPSSSSNCQLRKGGWKELLASSPASPQQDKPAGTAEASTTAQSKLPVHSGLAQEPRPNLTHAKRRRLLQALAAFSCPKAERFSLGASQYLLTFPKSLLYTKTHP